MECSNGKMALEDLPDPPSKLAFKDFLSRSAKTPGHSEKQQNRSIQGAVGQRRMTSQAAPHLRAKQANPKHLVATISFYVISVSCF